MTLLYYLATLEENVLTLLIWTAVKVYIAFYFLLLSIICVLQVGSPPRADISPSVQLQHGGTWPAPTAFCLLPAESLPAPLLRRFLLLASGVQGHLWARRWELGLSQGANISSCYQTQQPASVPPHLAWPAWLQKESRVRGALVSTEKMRCLFCGVHVQQRGSVLGKVLQRARDGLGWWGTSGH